MDFKFHIQGTEKPASRKLFVKYLPDQGASCFSCPISVSLASGETPEWVIRGLNMNYSEARFYPVVCPGPSQGISIAAGKWTEEIKFEIPLSILAAGCKYDVALTNVCDTLFISQIKYFAVSRKLKAESQWVPLNVFHFVENETALLFSSVNHVGGDVRGATCRHFRTTERW